MTVLPPFAREPELESVLSGFSGPIALARRGLVLPSAPGVYIVASGDCVSHIGTSVSLRGRVGQLAALGTHRGSAEVLCAAYCTKQTPMVWWEPLERAQTTALERQLKLTSGEPPTPRDQFASCVNGLRLRDDMIAVAGETSWEAGFIEAVFAIGEKLRLLFQPRFHEIWREVGVPPGPWTEFIQGEPLSS
jgi:hypothetical protein